MGKPWVCANCCHNNSYGGEKCHECGGEKNAFNFKVAAEKIAKLEKYVEILRAREEEMEKKIAKLEEQLKVPAIIPEKKIEVVVERKISEPIIHTSYAESRKRRLLASA